MLLATARFVITTIQRKFLYFVFFFPKVPKEVFLPSVVRGMQGRWVGASDLGGRPALHDLRGPGPLARSPIECLGTH